MEYKSWDEQKCTDDIGNYSLQWQQENSSSSYKTMYVSSVGGMKFFTGTGVPSLCINNAGYVGIGTIYPTYKLDVRGVVRANSLQINSVSGADYVFDENYDLTPISEVKNFITENRHLPDVPSADDMKQNGVSLTEIQITLLKKIEELTLYIVQQEEEIKQLKKQLNELTNSK